MSCFLRWLVWVTVVLYWTLAGVQGEELAFIRSRAHYMSSSLPVQPYSLSINMEDYHYAPKPKHLRSARLLRILGPSFDPFWMSIERPPNAGIWVAEEGHSSSPDRDFHMKGFDISASPELSEGAARYQRKLEKEAEDVELGSLPPEVGTWVRAWLVRSAVCGLRYRWLDLGPVFWPRWLRHTDCEESASSGSCSFPSGMACRRAQITHIKILVWHCWGSEDKAREGEPDSTGMGASGMRCVWRQVPYPVVTACKCSCK